MATVTLTTITNSCLRISLKGSGTVKVEYGDGASEKLTFTGSVTCRHDFTNSKLSTHSISITTMDGNSIITGLTCDCSKLTGTLNVSNLPNLKTLFCQNNQLDYLTFGDQPELETVVCHHNKLKELTNVSKLKKLKTLYCYNNQLNSLDVSGLSQLLDLSCECNNLKNLSFSGNTALDDLDCGKNNLGSLNVSSLKKLKTLLCYSNALSSLDVSGNTALILLRCEHNNLSRLSVSGLSQLTYLHCGFNQIGGADLNNLFNSLPTASLGANAKLYIEGNIGATNTSGCNTTTAINKNWLVYYPCVPLTPAQAETNRVNEINAGLRNITYSTSAMSIK